MPSRRQVLWYELPWRGRAVQARTARAGAMQPAPLASACLHSRAKEDWLLCVHNFYVFGFFFLPQVENEI